MLSYCYDQHVSKCFLVLEHVSCKGDCVRSLKVPSSGVFYVVFTVFSTWQANGCLFVYVNNVFTI